MAAFVSESISVSKTEDIEDVYARNDQERKLVDMVYFRSENSVIELPYDPFKSENSRYQSNNVMTTGAIEYYNDEFGY